MLVRPGTETFLRELSVSYEIVVFTAALQDYADWVLDQIDPHKYVSHRLYRQHAFPCGTSFVKDLSRLGRELSRVIIVDNVADNFRLQPENGILIKTWTDDPHDTALQELAPILKSITAKHLWIGVAESGTPDVRDELAKLSSQMAEQPALTS